jgi:hypothetical protein
MIPMRRTLFTVILCLVLIFASMILLIRTQPYQDGGLSAFLLPPDNCPAPCWSGIRPGETTLTGTSTLLQNNLQIKTVEAISPATAWLRFSAAMPLIQRARVNLWEENRGVVGRIELLDTGLSMSDLQLLLGAPTRVFLADSRQDNTSQLTALYSGYDLYVTVTITRCASSPAHFWQQANDVAISLGRWYDFDQLSPFFYQQAVELDPRRWVRQLRTGRTCP